VAVLYDVRCSILVVRKHDALLVHRTHDGLDDWVLPGGTPCEGEGLAACARRELLEWGGPEDYYAVIDETPEETERRRAAWPCTRLAALLSPELRRIG